MKREGERRRGPQGAVGKGGEELRGRGEWGWRRQANVCRQRHATRQRAPSPLEFSEAVRWVVG